MGRINTGKVILGGLAAGVVANLLDYVVQGMLMAEEATANAQRLGLNMQHLNSSSMMITWIVIDFIYGLIIAFTYAAIRPRFGPGPKTAVVASVTIWAAITAVMSGFVAIGIFASPTFMKHAAMHLAIAVIVGLVGAAIYKE